jgi:kumamolisin
MSFSSKKIAIRGSRRKAVPNALLLNRSNPEDTIQVSIFARRNPFPPADMVAKAKAASDGPISTRKYLTNDEFNQVYGAAQQDLDLIVEFAKSAGLNVIDVSVAKRRVLIGGTVSDIEKALGVELNEFEHTDLGRFRGREGQIHIPEELSGIIVGIEGLDTRPVGQSRRVPSQMLPMLITELAKPGQLTNQPLTNQWPGTFFPTEIAELYHYPTDADGSGQNMAIFAFNGGASPDPRGGYELNSLKTYYEDVLSGKTPTITDVVVQGLGNNPGPDTPSSSGQGDSTGEVMLDLCVAGSLVPGAHIFTYFTEFTSQGWVDAINEAVTDGNNISVISISYGNPEDDPNGAWTSSGVQLVNQAFEAAQSKGITVLCTSGDDGSSDQVPNGAHADFPASSPWVVGVGGTSLQATQGPTPQIASEVVWNDLNDPQPMGAGGGGVSSVFARPPYQNNAGVPPAVDPPHFIGRGVPDVAAVADPATGVVVIRVDGKSLEPIGGTSAAAPLWASLIVRLNQALGTRVGFLNPTLYTTLSTGVLNDIVSGNNGAYNAGPGWDACTGFGSPDGTKILNALKGS